MTLRFKDLQFASALEALLFKELGAKRLDDNGNVIQYEPRVSKAKRATVLKSTGLRHNEEGELDMGMFDHLKKIGIDTSEVTSDPMAVPDDTYVCVLKDVKLEEPAQEDWDAQVKFVYVIADGKYAKRHIFEQKRTPTETSAQEDEEAAVANLSYLFQRFSQLGVPEPEGGYIEVDFSEVRAMIGSKYRVTVKKGTATEDNPDPRQFVTKVKVYEEASTSSMLGFGGGGAAKKKKAEVTTEATEDTPAEF